MSWSRRHVLKVALAAGAAVALDAGARGTAALHAGHGDSPPPGPATVKAARITAVLSAAHLVAQFGGHFRRVFKGPLAATAAYGLTSTGATLREETQAYVTAVYKAAQWMKGAATTEIARIFGRYENAMGLSRASLIKVIDWYRPVWNYDLVLTRADYENGIRVARTIKAERAFPVRANGRPVLPSLGIRQGLSRQRPSPDRFAIPGRWFKCRRPCAMTRREAFCR